jgi:hypothetical protein
MFGSLCVESLIQGRDPNEGMRVAKLEREDRVPKVVPIDHQLRVPEKAHYARHGKSGNRGRILHEHPSCRYRAVAKSAIEALDLPENFQRCQNREQQLAAGT